MNSNTVHNTTTASLAVVERFRNSDPKGGAMRRLLLPLLAVSVMAMGLFAGTASASAQYGQCGPAVHNGRQLVNAWGDMGVLNSSEAATIAKSAGWNPGDGGMVTFLVQRGREFKLAKATDIEDYGCHVGSMFSVGTRHYGAGERIIGIVPSKYNPAQVSGTPRKGHHRVLLWVHAVGRGNCANGFRNLVPVDAYVPNKPLIGRSVPPKKHKRHVVNTGGWPAITKYTVVGAKVTTGKSPLEVFQLTGTASGYGKAHVAIANLGKKHRYFFKKNGRIINYKVGTIIHLHEAAHDGFPAMDRDVLIRHKGPNGVGLVNKKPAPSAPKPISRPQPQQPTQCVLNGVVGQIVNGVCVVNTTTQTQACSGTNCNQNANANTNTNNATAQQKQDQSTTVVVNVSPPPPPPPPPAPKPSADVSFNDVQEVNTNESRPNTCATVTTNLSMTIQFTADHGSWSNVSPGSANGSQLVCGTYTGPSEPGTDTWHVKVFYNGVLVKDAPHAISIVDPKTNP